LPDLLYKVPSAKLRRAADLLRAGQLVAFPTETVYGLGANALDENAVVKIFEAKGRPRTSPLIVHVASVEMLPTVISEWPTTAQRLAEKFWPGPLTLVLPKQANVPGLVTAGLDTVGVRMPAHPVALALIRECDLPLAAPSANRFTQLSPTTAEHVRRGLGERVDLVLDGGACTVGIESTVLSLAGDVPMLLRPGGISREQIEDVIGQVERLTGAVEGAHASPGLHERHYSPRTRLLLSKDGDVPGNGRGAYLQLHHRPSSDDVRVVLMPDVPVDYATTLYKTLHDLDAEGLDWIAVEQPPLTPGWEAVQDRLRRAAT
jgi:L-threonylcarbamoyladenylate synthase